MKKIPIIHCFDNNYIIPAVVAFYSLLKNSNTDFHYEIHVVHDSIPIEAQNKITESIATFPNKSLNFLNINTIDDNLPNSLFQIFNKLRNKSHYSKEIFYKLLIPNIFPNIDKAIIADVDVLYLGDVSQSFINFTQDSDYLLAAPKGLVNKNSRIFQDFASQYDRLYGEGSHPDFSFSAGFMIYNMKKLRNFQILEKFLSTLTSNFSKLIQPEQDVIAISCRGYIKELPPNTMVCTYSYSMFTNQSDYLNEVNYSANEVLDALKNPIQLHFAGNSKPWIKPYSTHSNIWHKYLFETTFANVYLQYLDSRLYNSKNMTTKVISNQENTNNG